MLKDITIGQYFPGNSALHKLDPRMKIIITCIYITLLFVAQNLYGVALGGALAMAGYTIAKIPLKMIGRSLKPVLPIVIFTALINMFFLEGGQVLVSFRVIKITSQGVLISIMMAARIICLIAGSSLLTYTTSPIALTDAIERLLNPLKKLKLPVHELAMMMTIALRFIPTLIDETDKIMSAQKARGADMEQGNLIQRAKALVPILIPLFISAFRRADELALAMECRCYRGDEGRTRMKVLKLTGKDFVGLFIIIGILGAIIALNMVFPSVYQYV